MGFWKKTDETKLERELWAQRPQPRDEFVRMLSRQVAPVRRTRRLAMPKVALVAAITAALAASLGAAGALGAAGGSVHAFSISVVHLVSPPKAVVVHTVAPPATSTSTGTTTSSGQTNHEDATPGHYPFEWQYGHRLAICWHGSIIYITPQELFFYLLHGARPPGLCLRWRTTG